MQCHSMPRFVRSRHGLQPAQLHVRRVETGLLAPGARLGASKEVSPMRATHVSGVAVLVLGLWAQPFFAQTDSATPCCVAVNFQTFNQQDVAIQLVSVQRTGPDDITVTWQILNRSKTPQQFDKMAGLAAYQL